MRIFVMLIIAGMIGLVAQRSDAPSPPESYSLKELKPGEKLIDPRFQRWLNEVNSYPEPLEMTEKEYQAFVESLHPTQQRLLEIKKLARKKRVVRQREVARIVKELRDPQLLKVLKSHHLYPDMINALLTTEMVKANDTNFFEAEITAWPGNFCPHKKSILRTLDIENKEILPDKEIVQFLDRIAVFHSERFKEKSLERLMEMVDEDKHQHLSQRLSEALLPYPKLVSDHDWLFSNDQLKSQIVLDKVQTSLEKADDALKRRRCNTAKKRLVHAIKVDAKRQYLPQVESISHKVESCFRRKGSRARLRYLSRMESHLNNRYGFKGREIVLRRKALIYWSRDKFEKTRKILDELLATAIKRNDRAILSRTLYTKARVDENEGKIAEAITEYEKFVSDFPKSEKIGEAITSLIMLHTLKKNHQLALSFAEKLIDMQTMMKVNDRDSGLLSLALFWAGKLNLQLGRPDQTQEYWRRLASEFYSTFYGAIGHYMLEALIGKKLVLQPSRVPSFNKANITKVLDQRGRKTIERIESLLALGLKNEASCETYELGGGPEDYRRNLVKSMYLYASGEWLNAIKKFVNLPRSFRHSLPRGMERLLFPRAYAPIVNRYAQRLGVDPAYVFAIIRQESVFNPQARSPVGATGLMQLMPATARLEARNLRRGYVASSHRQNLIRKSRKNSRLYDAETNLALGIHHVYRLFNKYKNPIYVLTSYNANPRATEKWLENIDTSDALAFVERIPYRETRAYVKLVMRNYFYYKRWYEKPGQSPFMDFLAPKSIELARAVVSMEQKNNASKQ